MEEAEEGDQTAMAPAEDADPFGVDPGVVLDRPVACREGVVDLEATVVDVLVHATAIAGGTPVLGRDHDIALGHQLTHDVGVVGSEIGVDPAVGQDQQWQLAGIVEAFRSEEVGVELEVVAGVDAGRVLFLPARRPIDAGLVDDRDIANEFVPQNIVDFLGEDVELVAGPARGLLNRGHGVGLGWIVSGGEWRNENGNRDHKE